MTNAKLINVYFDLEINEGCYVAAYDNGSTWSLVSHSLEGEDFEEFLHDVSKYIEYKKFEESIALKKYKSEIKRLEELNNKMYIELERLQSCEVKIKSQEKDKEIKQKLRKQGEYTGDLL